VELSRRLQFIRFEGGCAVRSEGGVVREALVRLHVNGRELVRMMCTPEQLDDLALGFLRSEGLIQEMADVRLLVVCPSQTCVDVWLRNANLELPGQPVLTSGCGGGITFADLEAAGEPVRSELRVRAGQIGRLMAALLAGQEVRGSHRAGLADTERLLAVADDVGRHNTLDKIWGYCLREGIETQEHILLTTGRVSSEMLGKAARMGVRSWPHVADQPIGGSRGVEYQRWAMPTTA
jgi:FdhD protein